MVKLRSAEAPSFKYHSAEAPSRRYRHNRLKHTDAFKKFVEKLKRTRTTRNPFAVATIVFQAQGKQIFKKKR